MTNNGESGGISKIIEVHNRVIDFRHFIGCADKAGAIRKSDLEQLTAVH